MSEKRFEKVTPFAVNDTWDNHRPIECASSLDADVVCHYLNEQQEIIELLKKEGICLASMFEEQIKENEQLRQSVNYWQKKYEEGTETFVSEKLNELYEENKRLKEELNDCEKFRYIVFKKIEEIEQD